MNEFTLDARKLVPVLHYDGNADHGALSSRPTLPRSSAQFKVVFVRKAAVMTYIAQGQAASSLAGQEQGRLHAARTMKAPVSTLLRPAAATIRSAAAIIQGLFTSSTSCRTRVAKLSGNRLARSKAPTYFVGASHGLQLPCTGACHR